MSVFIPSSQLLKLSFVFSVFVYTFKTERFHLHYTFLIYQLIRKRMVTADFAAKLKIIRHHKYQTQKNKNAKLLTDLIQKKFRVPYFICNIMSQWISFTKF